MVRTLGKKLGCIKDRALGRSLDKPSIRQRLSAYDWAEFICVGFVAAGLYCESNRFWEANTFVTLGVFGEFVIHRLHAIASKREEQLSDDESKAKDIEIERLRAEAETARLETARLRERMMGRRLSLDQQNALILGLRDFMGFPNTLVSFIVCGANSGEKNAFAAYLEHAIFHGGWKTVTGLAYRATTVFPGLIIEAETGATLLATKLLAALQNAQVAVAPTVREPLGGDVTGHAEAKGAPIRINIGDQPA